MVKIAVVLLLLLSYNIAFAGQKEHSKTQSPSTSAQERSSTSASTGDVQALRQDITRMKALVQQMQSNLAFVDTTQSPLKHQFQLEIEMWQTLITEMDHRLDQASRPAQ